MRQEREWGFIRETADLALRAGKDRDTGVCRTGLDEYLSVIFPSTNDWIHDKPCGLLTESGRRSNKRPDYRSDSLRMIVEVDGLPHYTSPEQILKDVSSTQFYESHGYTVVRIPYFIQLSREAIRTLFQVDVGMQLFDESVPSMGPLGRNTPAFLCYMGVRRMAEEFQKFPKQYETNMNALKAVDQDELAGWDLLERAMEEVRQRG